jgi:hypothetical protein
LIVFLVVMIKCQALLELFAAGETDERTPTRISGEISCAIRA